MSSLYHQGQYQLQSIHQQLQATRNDLQATQSHLQATHNEVENTRRQISVAERELQQEREASELLNQEFAELQACHYKLEKEYESAEGLQEGSSQSVTNSRMFADKVARRAESLVNNLQAKLARGEVAELQNR